MKPVILGDLPHFGVGRVFREALKHAPSRKYETYERKEGKGSGASAPRDLQMIWEMNTMAAESGGGGGI